MKSIMTELERECGGGHMYRHPGDVRKNNLIFNVQ